MASAAKVITIGMSLILAGCTTPLDNLKIIDEPGVPIRLTAEQIASVKSGVQRRLKDPDSARFDEIIAVRNPKGEYAVCGFVNSRNSYGGYVGMQPFAGLLLTYRQTSFELISLNDGKDAFITFRYCRNAGARLS